MTFMLVPYSCKPRRDACYRSFLTNILGPTLNCESLVQIISQAFDGLSRLVLLERHRRLSHLAW